MKRGFLGGVAILALILMGDIQGAAPVGALRQAVASNMIAVETELENSAKKTVKAEEPVKELNEGVDLKVDKTFVDFGFAKELGRSYTSEFVIRNEGKETAKVDLRVRPYKEDCAEESRQGEDWLVFVGGKNYYEIPGGEEAKVRLRFNLPKDAETDRSQYALVEVATGEVVRAEVNVKISVVGEDDERSFGGEVKQVEANFFGLSDKLKGQATVENNGRIGFEAKLRVKASPAFGLEDWREVYAGSAELAPSAKVNFGYEGSLGYGVFKVEQVINYVNHDGKAVVMTNMRRVLLLPSWVPFALVGILFAIILLVIIVKMRKKKQAEAQMKPEDMAQGNIDSAASVAQENTRNIDGFSTESSLTEIWGESENKDLE